MFAVKKSHKYVNRLVEIAMWYSIKMLGLTIKSDSLLGIDCIAVCMTYVV